jgi:hypothetical protein
VQSQVRNVASPRRAALNWVDCLVIAATALTFLAVVLASSPHSRKARAGFLLQDVAPQSGQVTDNDLVKARVKLANGGPWS